MRESPTQVTNQDVLACAQTWWNLDSDAAEHLPVGFGAHHWLISSHGKPLYFATWDVLNSQHTADSLEAAYQAAVAIAVDLEFVLAPLPRSDGHCIASLEGGWL